MTASVATWPATNGRNLYDAEPEELLVDFEACAPSLFETDEEVNVTIRTYRDDSTFGFRVVMKESRTKS